MKTAEELLANKDLSFFDMSNKGVWEEVKAVINEARKEAIEECATIAEENLITGGYQFIVPTIKNLINNLK